MIEKVVIILIFLLACLAIIPPMFYFGGIADGLFFEKSFFIILFLSLTGICGILPYAVPKLPGAIKIVSMFCMGWFLSMLIYEFANIFKPEIILESPAQLYVWIKYASCFLLGIALIIISKTIKSWIPRN